MLERLQNRNRRESKPFNDLIAQHSKVFDKAASLQQENHHLLFVNEKLKREPGSVAVGSDPDRSGAEVSRLSAKVLALQEELTELHRRKGM